MLDTDALFGHQERGHGVAASALDRAVAEDAEVAMVGVGGLRLVAGAQSVAGGQLERRGRVEARGPCRSGLLGP